MPPVRAYTDRLYAIRGWAVVAMIVYHIFAIEAMVYAHVIVPTTLFWLCGKMIAIVFIMVSGVGFALQDTSDLSMVWRNTLRRSRTIGLYALGITIATYLLDPELVIIWGILHFFALSGLLMPLWARASDRAVFVSAVVCGIVGIGLSYATFSLSCLAWIGIRTEAFFSADYYPLLPWLGVLLAGLLVGRMVYRYEWLKIWMQKPVSMPWIAGMGQ